MSSAKALASVDGTTAELKRRLAALETAVGGAEAAVALGAAIHELATNAVKYGALPTPGGRIRIATQVEDADLVPPWLASGGPPVEPRRRRGFGGRILEKGLAGALGGEVRLDYRTEGLFCRMRLPMRTLEPDHDQ